MSSPGRSSSAPRRLGLYAPLLLLALAAAAWSLGWLWLAGQVERRLDAARAGWSGEGRELSWSGRKLYGFPFRLDVDFTGFSAREPSGWSIAAPSLQAEALIFAPTHWIIVAPAGAVFNRGRGGPVRVKAKVLRASVSELGRTPPRISVEGLDLTFDTPPDAAPYFLTAASEIHFHTRAGPGDQGAVYLKIDRASARLGGLLGRIAGGKPLNITGDLTYSRADQLSGPDWPSAVRRWRDAGGAASVRRIEISAGDAILDARAGRLSVDEDGRLRGSLQASLRQAPRALRTMGQTGAITPEAADTAAAVVTAGGAPPVVAVTIRFEAGETTLGPAAIGPAPRVY